MTVVVEVHDVSKRFVLRKDKSLKERLVNARRGKAHAEDFWALRDVNLEIEEGATVGLIGPNGSGKSTLLKTIGGIIEPTTGWVGRRGRLAALLELGAGFHPDLTGRENVYLNASILGLSRQQTDRHFQDIVEFSGIERFIDTQVKFYSSGMYVRLAFSVAVHADPDLLLVDEVLAVGDEAFQRKCLDRIKTFQGEGRTIVLVSHALDQVRDICDRAVLLEAGRVQLDGTPVDALRMLRADFEAEREQVDTAAEDAAGPRPVSVADVRVLGGDGLPAETFSPGDQVRIRVTAVATGGAVEDWAVGIGLENHTGQAVYGTNTVMAGVDLGVLEGSRTVEFTLLDIPLPDGQYLITAAVHPRHGAEYHRRTRCAGFAVTSNYPGVGLIHVATQIGLLDQDAERVQS
jgi:ABC-2 type transport system ATP-binding protein